MGEIKIVRNVYIVLDQDKTSGFYGVTSSRATWKNISGSSSIDRTRLNHNDSHLSVSSEPLIEDEMANLMVTSKSV